MARIRIYIGRHLCTAPRPQKEADALAAAGHEVSVHGVAYRADFAARDAELARGRAWTWSPVADFTRNRIDWFWTRLRHRIARECCALTGRPCGDVWGYAHARIRRHALTRPADLTLVHAEGGLAIAAELLDRSHRVGADFEDWFSQDLAPAQRRGRPVAALAALEQRLLRATPYALATSRAMADAMAEKHASPPPTVIHNTFDAGPEPALPDAPPASVSLHWFSLVIGPERGLETLFDSLPAVRGSWTLHLRGEAAPGYREALLARLPAPLQNRIHFTDTVPAAKLPSALAEHDVGLALEVSTIPSRNLTITNKFFHYLQAGLAVVASDTAGHREGLAAAPEAGVVFPAGDASALAAALNAWTTRPERIPAARRDARAAFVRSFAHELQTPRYGELAAAALSAPCVSS